MSFLKRLIFFLVFGLAFIFCCKNERRVDQSAKINKIRQEGYNLRFTDTIKSLAEQKTALALAKKESKSAEISISYALLSLSYKKNFQTANAQLYTDSSVYLAQKIKDPRALGYAYLSSGLLKSFFNETDQALNQLLLSYQNFEKIKDYANLARAASEISYFYSDKDIAKEEKYAKTAIEAATKAGSPDEMLFARLAYGSFLLIRNRNNSLISPDKPINYFKETIRLIEQNQDKIHSKSNISIAYFNLAVLYFEHPFPGSESLLFELLDKSLVLAKLYNQKSVYRNSLGLRGEYYIQKKDYASAEKLFKEGIAYHESMPFKEYFSLSQFYASLKKIAVIKGDFNDYVLYDEAYQKYNKLEFNEATAKALQNADVRFESVQKANTIRTLEKENKLQRSNKWFGYGMAILLGIVLLFMFRSYYFRQKYYIQNETIFKDRQKTAELQLQLEKLETAAAMSEKLSIERRLLQSQINPHFVFNALGSIQSFVLQNDTQNAVSYLGKFSKLMRQILEFTTKDFIPLEDEIDTLKNYIEMQQLRLNNGFDFTLLNDVADHGVSIPPMLIQPFIENAIEHGLKPLSVEKRGVLSIVFSGGLNNSYISCTIIDNGIGIDFSMLLKTKNNARYEHKSMGTSITKERLFAMNTDKNIYGFTIEEMKDTAGAILGTKAIITIPLAKI